MASADLLLNTSQHGSGTSLGKQCNRRLQRALEGSNLRLPSLLSGKARRCIWLRDYEITYMNSPVWSLLHLVTKSPRLTREESCKGPAVG